MVFWVVSIFLAAGYISILMVYRYGWFLAYKNSQGIISTSSVRVSVIIPMRNEAGNLPGLMHSLLSQDYPPENMEIILIDDSSTDDTLAIAQQFEAAHSHVKVFQLDTANDAVRGKKRAIEAGIGAATNPWIVCTDADCVHHPHWLQQMAGPFFSGKKFAAAPVVFHTRPSFLSVFQSLDFLTLQGITAASVSLRLHSMCNGANLAYSRSAFYEVNGFEGIDLMPTGDDMLLMHKIFMKYPDGVQYVLNKQAIVETEAPQTWRAFFQQRIRWASKAAYFDDRRIFWVLLLVYLFNCWFLFATIGVFIFPSIWPLLVGLLFMKIICELFFIWPVANFFGKEKWLGWFPLLQPVHICYTIIAGWLGRFGSYSWKGRTINKPSALTNGSQNH
jgi:cellulose synthase/poly-beta-1,6-N-acetylglucosamine synthase-like glycosyltransferase